MTDVGNIAAAALLDDHDHLVEIWAIIGRLSAKVGVADADPPLVGHTGRSLTVVVGPSAGSRSHVSVSHPVHEVSLLPHSLGGRGVRKVAEATHCTVDATVPPPWLDADYFIRT